MLNRNLVIRELRDVLLLAAVGFLMTWSGLTCRNCIDSPREFWIIASFASLIWIVLWKGNAHLGDYVTGSVSWLEHPERRFFYSLAFTIVYTFAAMYTLGGIYYLIFDVNLTPGAIYSVVVTIIISLFMHGRSFLINWKQTSINAERLERESIKARYESLRSQVNPHFLFNSFNALTNLVHEDPDKAVRFIKQLSEVYRYVLDTREREVVSLEEEVTFLRSYLYLQEIRFGDKLRVDVQLEDLHHAIPPLALQMLIENAIKHNIVSAEHPLKIFIFVEDGYVVVRNSLQRRLDGVEHSPGIGLENIRRRYEFLSDKRVGIAEIDGFFVVKLPLLAEISHEVTDH